MAGGGDCDEDSQCDGDLVCGSDNCFRDFSSSGSNWVAGADCCRGTNQSSKILYINFYNQIKLQAQFI